MSTPGLAFEHIHVRRMPGFQPPGFPVEDLCPGVNVIYGPNASGKTTVANAIHALLWPRNTAAAASRASLVGRVRLDGANWSVDLDTGHVRYQRDGTDTPPPLLPPVEMGDRYNLALHELLRYENENDQFAEAILRESAGGYDAAGAGEKLGFRSAASRATQEKKDVGQARDALKDARQPQEELANQESELQRLKEQRGETAEAKRRADLLERAITRADAAHDRRHAESALNAFPPQMAHITGRETADLADLRKELDDLHERERMVTTELADAERALTDGGLPEGGLAENVVLALREDLRALQDMENAIQTKQREHNGVQRQCDEAARSLAGAVDPEKLANLDAVAMDELADFAHRAEDLRARRKASVEMQRWLGEPAAATENLSELQIGIQALHAWLREASGPARRDPWMKPLASAAALVIVGAAVALAVLAHGLWLALSLVGIAVFAAGWWPRATTGDRQTRRRDYEKLALDPPRAWEPEPVEDLATDLCRRLAEGQIAHERAQRRADLEAPLREIEEQALALAQEREQLVARFGVAPGTDEATLHLLANRISRWQDAAHQAAGLDAQLKATEDQRDQLLEKIAARLAPYGYDQPTDAADASGAVNALEHRRQQHDTAANARRAAEDKLADLRDRITRLESARHQQFEALGLTPDDEATLDEWCRRRDQYLEAKDRLLRADERLRNAERHLSEHPDDHADMKESPREQLETELRECRARAERWNELNDQIVKIEDRIHSAKQAHNVEDALAGHERCLDALAEKREQDYAAVVGSALVDHLRQETRDRERPAVFHRARQLLIDITRGRYQLEFEDRDGPAFRALDTTTGDGHGLDELSSGTRVQLLLAVRIAFVETQEQGVRLPLILDETLANSDDARAQAIIEAALTISKAGRQVFYFTAQDDEVGKWIGATDGRGDVPCRFIDLAEVRRLAAAQTVPKLKIDPPPRRVIPQPGAMSHREYGTALGAPPIDPWTGVGAVHIWHLLEDTRRLHRLLDLDIETWGQLRTLTQSGGFSLLHDDPAVYPRIEAAARAVECVCRCWRIGQGKPVDRAVLVDSEAVSDIFIEQVAALAEELDGDAAQLLTALEDGQAKGFRTKNIERLRDDLIEQEYLATEEKLSAREIRRRVTAAVEADLRADRLTTQTIDRLMGAIPSTSAPVTHRATGNGTAKIEA